uniref:Uncharacterized protein n=1 Tax=Oryza barthii TaxID=65489 RepID=A0A0D3GRU7_9ORYZ
MGDETGSSDSERNGGPAMGGSIHHAGPLISQWLRSRCLVLNQHRGMKWGRRHPAELPAWKLNGASPQTTSASGGM